jgi:hypothetical protein
MSGPSKLSVALVVALALCLPSFEAVLDGSLPMPVAGLRFLVALTFVRVALAMIAGLMSVYAADAAARAAADAPARRESDRESGADATG